MPEFYAHEVGGKVLLRRSGHNSRHIEVCEIVTTRVAMVQLLDGEQRKVAVPVVIPGLETFVLPKWFSNWSDADDLMTGDPQSGRQVKVAVPELAFKHMVRTGALPPPCESHDRNMLFWEQNPTVPACDFGQVVAAMLIDDEWVVPLKY